LGGWNSRVAVKGAAPDGAQKIRREYFLSHALTGEATIFRPKGLFGILLFLITPRPQGSGANARSMTVAALITHLYKSLQKKCNRLGGGAFRILIKRAEGLLESFEFGSFGFAQDRVFSS
jgi:hypothetical protein